MQGVYLCIGVENEYTYADREKERYSFWPSFIFGRHVTADVENG